jgi:tRNA(Ile)-lysidine synthase
MASIEDLLSSRRTISGKRFESDDYVVLAEREALRIVAKSGIPDSIGNVIMPVRCAGTYHFNGVRIKVEVCPWTPEMPLKQAEGVLVFDAGRLRFPFVLRQWRNGDWFIPLGMRGKKKVSDLFTDLKYDAFQKASAVIVSDVNSEGMAESQHIAGVAGVRIDDLYKVTPTTSSVIRVTVLS